MGLPGGPGQLFRLADAHDKFSLGSFGSAWRSRRSGSCWSTDCSSTCRTSASIRATSAVSRRPSRKRRRDAACGSAALLYVPISAVFFFIGTALFAFYRARPERSDCHGDRGRQPTRCFRYFIVTELPGGVTGLVIASIFAAAQCDDLEQPELVGDAHLHDYLPALSPARRDRTRRSWPSLREHARPSASLGTGMALAMMQMQERARRVVAAREHFQRRHAGTVPAGLVRTPRQRPCRASPASPPG